MVNILRERGRRKMNKRMTDKQTNRGKETETNKTKEGKRLCH